MIAPPNEGPGVYLGTVGRHEAEYLRAMRGKGGVIGTGGKPVVSFRIDHGLQEFFDNGYAAKFKSRGLPVSVGIVASTMGQPNHPYEPLTYTADQIRVLFRTYGFEAWSHSYDHMDPTNGGADVWTQVVGAKKLIESAGIRVVGYQAGGVPNCGCPHFSNNFRNVQTDRSGWDWQYGGLIIGNFGLYNVLGDQGGQVRYLPTRGDGDLGHATLDTMTLAQAQALVNYAIDHSGQTVGTSKGSVIGINFMTHPRQVEGGPSKYPNVVMTPANWMIFIDWCADLWEQGRIDIMSNSALAFADGAHSQTVNLLMDPTFATAPVPSGSSTYPWAKAGGTGVFSIETGTGPGGENVLVMPNAGAYTYAYQGNAQIQSLDLAGNIFEAGAWFKSSTATTPARITALNPSITDVNHVDYLNVQTSFNIPNDGAWHYAHFAFTLPMNIDNLQFRVSRGDAGTSGDLRVTRCSIRPR